jgi:hypothetical protein
VDAPPIPGITVVIALRNPAKQILFGVNVVDKVPGTSLADPAVRQVIETLLHQFSYQFYGHSSIKIGGLDWLQYPVHLGPALQQTTGAVRFTSANGYIFAVTLVRSGGLDALQDVEVQQAAGSFRVAPMTPIATIVASTPPAPATPVPIAIPKTLTPFDRKPPENAPVATGARVEEEGGFKRWIWPAGAGAVILLVLFAIISGSGKKPKAPSR